MARLWGNYLTVGLRALRRDPMLTAINLFGLAVGLAACLLIILFIRYELSFDDWLPDAARTYQVQRISTDGADAGERLAQASAVGAATLPSQFPEIEAATGIVPASGVFRNNGEPLEIQDIEGTDANFLKVLRLPLVAGDPERALADVGSIVLTETAARTLFGRTDVLGRAVTRITTRGDQAARITGVLRDLPANSHLRIGGLYRPNLSIPDGTEAFTKWNWISGWVYVRLRPGADPAAMSRRMPGALQRLVPTSERDVTARDGLGFTQALMNVRDVNTGPVDSGAMRPGTPMKTLATFGIIAAFLLLVACVNFANLATARASRRAREVGLRKTLGASRTQLVVQFLGEALVTVAASGLLALTFVEIALPFLNDTIGGRIPLRYVGEGGIVLPFLALLLVVGLLGGVYPAFFLSRYRPAQVLKANQSGGDAPGAGRLRIALVVVQFAVSIGLIVCTAIIYSQTLYARSRDPGYRVAGLFFVPNPELIGDRTRIETFMRQAAALPGVTSVARVGVTPNPETMSVSSFRAPGAPRSVGLQVVTIDGAAVATLGLRLLAGRAVTEQREADVGAPMFHTDADRDRLVDQRGLNVMVDESGARRLGFPSPQAALGRQVSRDTDDGHAVAPYTIVGIVNDAHFESARFESMPKLYFVVPTGHAALAMRLAGAGAASVPSRLEALWKANAVPAPFRGFFADSRIADMYKSDERRARTFAVFAAFAILISCLGLFALAAFAAERRTKEIGIRNVFGARTRDIVGLLSWQFLRPVLIANLIAWPIAWWAMQSWLNDFHTRIVIGLTPFLLAALLAILIAAGTIVGHAIRVARMNPIHALRYE